MVKEFNHMSQEEKDNVRFLLEKAQVNEANDFLVEGKRFTEMYISEQAIVYMQIQAGYEEVTSDKDKYDKTTVVLSDEEYIISNTPYGYVGVSNVIQKG